MTKATKEHVEAACTELATPFQGRFKFADRKLWLWDQTAETYRAIALRSGAIAILEEAA